MRSTITAAVFLTLCCCSATAWRPGFLGKLFHATTQPSATWPGGPEGPSYPSYPGGGGGGGNQPSWPGWTPSPPAADELPLMSGQIINMYSHVLDKYCNVGPADEKPAYALRCEEDEPSLVQGGLVIIATAYESHKIFDGSKVQLKSQRENKICSIGKEKDRFPVTCGDDDATSSSDFVIKRAKGRDDLYYIAPAFIPSHRCYPAHSAPDHGGAAVWGALFDHSRGHILRCDGHHHGDNALFHIAPAEYWKPPASALAGNDNVAVAAPSYPGGSYPYPGGPSGPAGPSPAGPPGPGAGPSPSPSPSPSEPELPFGVGSTVQLSAPFLEDNRICDVKDAGWTLTAEGILTLSEAGNQVVMCDRKGPDGPGAAFQQVGFLTLPDERSARTLKSGAELAFSSIVTRKLCRATKNGKVKCDAEDGDKKAKFKVYLASSHDDDDTSAELQAGSGMLAGLLQQAKAWLSTQMGLQVTQEGQNAEKKAVNIHLLHIESDRWCGADEHDKHATLVCKHDNDNRRHNKPILIAKVQGGWQP